MTDLINQNAILLSIIIAPELTAQNRNLQSSAVTNSIQNSISCTCIDLQINSKFSTIQIILQHGRYSCIN